MKEYVLYCDEQGNPSGEKEEKLSAHTAETRMHLAFSCYVFDDDGRLLITKRAESKKVWPGVWTNSFCGHLAEGETAEDALKRRGSFELGIGVENIECLVADYTYKTTPFNGIIEHEFCPIFRATLVGNVTPNPAEVGDYGWVTWGEYAERLHSDNADLWSWWAKDQFRRIADLI